MKEYYFRVENDGVRLDKFLSTNLDIPRNQIEHLIKTNGIEVNNIKIYKCGLSLKIEDKIKVVIPETKKQSSDLKVDFEVPIIYEDEDILVINKPSNLTVHRAMSEKNLTVVDWLESKNISLSTISGEDRNGIVHRLDKVTSGVMVIAKNNTAHSHLSSQLQNKTMGRYYLAIISPLLKEDCIIDKPIGRSKNNRLKMTTHNMINPREAKTEFRKLISSTDLASELIVAKLFSGRTHQIRVHLQSMQRHTLGDMTYGFKGNWGFPNKIFLQAYILYLKHPKNNEEMLFFSDLDNDMLSFLQTKFDIGEINDKISTKHILSLFNDSR